METSTTIKKMLSGNEIYVPSYQRAYSWDTDKQVKTFLSDLEEYNSSKTKSKYYFGHFLFEEKEEEKFGVIDGQQRLTTIVIFISALFARLKKIRVLEKKIFEDIIERNLKYRFLTVDYDNLLFREYVIDQSKKDKNGLETESAKRIVSAFDFFVEELKNKDEEYLLKMLEIIQNSSCTTHIVKDESEAIQMFIFQNNRGKKPSNLEIIKAQFMFNVHLYGGEGKDTLINEIKSRFEKIYKSISSIEYNIDEDEILVYTLRVHFNSLWETNAIDKINDKLSKDDSISFIQLFTKSLTDSFEYLKTFFKKDQVENFKIHSLVSLGNISIAIPFIIKAYKLGLPKEELSNLCSSLESLVFRHRLVGTRADMTSRLNDCYKEFGEENPNVQSIIDHIEYIKNSSSDNWWWAYWNNDALKNALQGWINPSTAKFILWKYENYLETEGNSGYLATRFDMIIDPELEHIAPKTENPEAGYDNYDDEFNKQHIECLGNYLLLSKSHNCSVGNKPFVDKRNSYTKLNQQREIKEMTQDNQIWTRELIQKRKDKIIQFIMDNM